MRSLRQRMGQVLPHSPWLMLDSGKTEDLQKTRQLIFTQLCWKAYKCKPRREEHYRANVRLSARCTWRGCHLQRDRTGVFLGTRWIRSMWNGTRMASANNDLAIWSREGFKSSIERGCQGEGIAQEVLRGAQGEHREGNRLRS